MTPPPSLAREHNFPLVAIVFDVGEEAAIRQNYQRQDRQVSAEVIRRQCEELSMSRKSLSREGFSRVYILKSLEEVAAATVVLD